MGGPSGKPRTQTYHHLLLSPSQHHSSGMERKTEYKKKNAAIFFLTGLTENSLFVCVTTSCNVLLYTFVCISTYVFQSPQS